jgi:DNA-binding NarL/FixJ family response regulator
VKGALFVVDTHCTGALRDGPAVTFLIATKSRLYGEGLAACLEHRPNWRSSGTTTDPAAICDHVGQNPTDVVLLDVALAGSEAVIRTLAGRTPPVHVIALVLGEDPRDVLPYVEAGVGGFVARDATLATLRSTVEQVLNDEVACSPQLTRSLMRAVHSMASRSAIAVQQPNDGLTTRQREIAELVALGMANKEIASKLCIDLSTVKNHVHAVLKKLGLERRGQITARLYELGLFGAMTKQSA